MKKSPILLFVISIMFLELIVSSARSEILISELCDPRSNYATDRFIEIYNSGSAEVDLSGWSLVAVGNSTDIFTWNLSGLISPEEALVAGDQTITVDFPVDFPDEGWSDNNGTWNGKVGDGAKLLDPDGAVIDYVVVTGTAFENSDYVRNPDIALPNPTFTPSEWTATPVTYPTDGSPGVHIGNPPIPGPVISNIITHPDFPEAGMEVSITADVTDSISTITSVKLRWGTTISSLSNGIVMTLTVGNTYLSDTPIPAQSEGTTVYFHIEAENDSSGTSTSDMRSYAIHYVLMIHEIQGNADSSPYDGFEVITHGIVTAVNSEYYVLQDAFGSWNGIWVQGTEFPSISDSVTVRGTITENAGSGNAGNTVLTNAIIMSDSSGFELPEAIIISTTDANSEEYEGVLVKVESAVCTNPNVNNGEWEINDGSGTVRVGHLFYDFEPILGSSYDIRGPLTFTYDNFKIELRNANDITWVGDNSAPIISSISASNDTSILVTFSEDVEQTSAEMVSNYTIENLDIRLAEQDGDYPERVLLTVSAMSEGEYTLTVNGVVDLYGNSMVNVVEIFEFIESNIPEGYYDDAENLTGENLRAALHDIIKNHDAYSYDYAWTAFWTTDDKPNGKVWDIYSDVPGGTPPYEYTFGVDQGGIGGQEGNGYTREHSFPKSWFGGSVMPMYADLFALYPCDAHVNGNRGNYPYGEVSSPEWTSLNGSKRGPNSYAGYTGIVFEPIDAYKGDLARTYFYMTTKYYTEDANWAGSPMTDGANLLPWAVDMLLEWHEDDPVSRKEIDRNNAIYKIQNNRNPYIDHPEFVDPWLAQTAADDEVTITLGAKFENIYPNPANLSTTIRYSIPENVFVSITVYNVLGQRVATLVNSDKPAGIYNYRFNTNELSSGIYFCRFQTGIHYDIQKIVIMK